MKEFRNPVDVHPPVAGYTHQVEIQRPQRLLVLSGQIGRRLDGSVPEDALEQLDLAFENLFCNLRAAKMDLDNLIKITFYLVGDMDPVKRGEIITRRLQGRKPCMTLVYVVALAGPAYKVEIDAWACEEKE